MNKTGKFCCPKCEAKLPLKSLFIGSFNKTIPCPVCHAILKPKKEAFPYWVGYIIGVFSSVVPILLFLYFIEDNIFKAILCGLSFGALATCAGYLYIYIKTEFIEV